MNNLDFFKLDIHVGDIALIELTSGKSIQGEVLEIAEYVLIKKEDGKTMRLLDGIIGGWELIGAAEDNSDYKKETVKADVSGIPSENSHNIVERDSLDKAQIVEPKPKLKQVGKSLDALSAVFKDINKEGNSKPLPVMGYIKKVGPGFAFIQDTESAQRIFVPLGEFCESNLNLDTPVVYSYGENRKGVFAKAVHKAGSVAEAIILANELFDSGEVSKSFWVLKHILDVYPHNVDASKMMDLVRETLFPKRQTRTRKIDKKENIGKETTKRITPPTIVEGANKSSNSHPEKPKVIDAPETKEALPLDLPKMTDAECREKERELDALIRNGERERCLELSYQLLSQRCPTPKYLRSYLDRIANTEVALNHTAEAIGALAQLIHFSENQADTKATNLSHLYVFLARLLKKQDEAQEAEKALNCAEYCGANGSVIQGLRDQIRNGLGHTSDNRTDTKGEVSSSGEIGQFSVSKMLQQDVEQIATSLSADANPDNLLHRALKESSPSSNKTFEVKAQFFLEAAACYWTHKEDSKAGYKNAVANYARMKGDAMYTMLQNTIHFFPENKNSLLAYSDSACSYYTEALGIFNELKQKDFLQELFLKYLKLRRVSSQILGGRTPDPEWHNGTLKALLRDCLDGEDSEDLKAFVRTCISVGASTEAAWNSLCQDADGTGPFIGRLSDDGFRLRTFRLFNDIEGASVSVSLKATEFLHTVFSHRQQRNEQLYSFLSEISKWDFDPIDISSISDEWGRVEEYRGILLPSDERTCSNISNVINILLDYTDSDPIYRNNLLIQAQQAIQKSIKEIAETTTYLGRVFFAPLETNWLDGINNLLSLYYASKEPRLRITPDPATIRRDESGYLIVFRVSNVGETPATSFTVAIADSSGKVWPNIENERLSVGEEKTITWSIPEPIVPVIEQDQRVSLSLEATPFYQGRTLKSTQDIFVFEIESSMPLERKEIPWEIEATPPDNIFKGRDKDLTTLVNHYKSCERGHTYILYGLTRTGKTSMLEYLRIRLNGVALDEKPNWTIMPFAWDFNKVVFDKTHEAQFWEHLVKTQIYDMLSPELKLVVNRTYDARRFPTVVSQNDFLHLIETLNNNKILPFITIDEFSNVKNGMESGMLNASFLGILRDLALTGRASFIYAGTYDIKELPNDPQYGYTGQLAHTYKMPVNAIDDKYANELIDAWDKLHFEEDAKSYIRYLSGCVPYWIQWICLNCGKYAVIQQKHYLGVHDVDEVVKIMTGEERDEDEIYTWGKIDEINFQNNQVMTDNGKPAEEALITSIAYLNRNNLRRARGISTKELDSLWGKNNVSKEFQGEMLYAIKRMMDRDTLIEETEDNRLVYRLSVDLFRRCWYVNHKNISTVLAHK